MRPICRFLVAVLIACGLMAITWAWFAPGRLYICSDSFPPTEFLPPFIHYDPSGHAYEGDRYLQPPAVVYGVWVVLYGVSIGVGATVTRLFSKSHDPAVAVTRRPNQALE